MRVFVLNNYDLVRVWGEVSAGEKPSHHLYGIDRLRAHNWSVIIASTGPAWVRAIDRVLRLTRFPVPLGDLGPQWEIWRRARRGDIVYAPCQTQSQLLSYLRACDAWNVPIVTLAHHPLTTGRLAWMRRAFHRLQMLGTDRFPALSRGVSQEIERLAKRPGLAGNYAPVLRWGPDLSFYARWSAEYPGHGVVASGRTGRDWATFGHAATAVGLPTRIACLARDVNSDFAEFGSNVHVSQGELEWDQSYPKLLSLMARARVLAIPLLSTDTLAGLTSLTDALGLGKPVIMTRHPLIDLDIEAAGIGRWVDPNDVSGWVAALRWFDTHPDEASAMGRRALAIAGDSWNSGVFNASIERVLREAAVGP